MIEDKFHSHITQPWAVYSLIHLCFPNYWSVSENGTRRNLILIFSDVPSILRKTHNIGNTPPPPPSLQPCGQPRDVTSNEFLNKSQGRSFRTGGSLDRYAAADVILSVGKQRGVVSRHDHIGRQRERERGGGRRGMEVKQTHPTAQIDGLCCSLSDIHTATHRQRDGQEEAGVGQTLFYTYSISRFTVSHKKNPFPFS